tara:strand:+ start:455 stop:694 length:240 start_codon:yes stop_codon:yes gene_type:complete
MAIKGKIRANPNIKGKTKPGNQIQAQTLKLGTIALADLTDVNATGQGDGAMIVYDGATSTYKVSPTVDNPNTTLTGGTY